MSSNKITHEARIRSLQDLPADAIKKMRELEIKLAERRLKKLREAFAEDQSDINIAFEADGLSFARRNKGWEPSPNEGSEP